MLVVKFHAADIRTIMGASTTADIEGAIELVRDRIKAAETLKLFGATTAPNKFERVGNHGFDWRSAIQTAKEILGQDNVIHPPSPDYTWYRRINSTIKNWNIDAARVVEIAEYVKANMRLPINFDFMICQHPRILAGEFDATTQRVPRRDGALNPKGPDLGLHKLPEE